MPLVGDAAMRRRELEQLGMLCVGILQMRVGLERGPEAASAPTEVVKPGYFTSPTSFTVGPMYDVSPDGQRFLMIRDARVDQTPAPARVIVVQHWFEELKRLLPVK